MRLLDHQVQTIGCFMSIPLALANVAIRLAAITALVTLGLVFFVPSAVSRGVDLTIALLVTSLIFVLAAIAIFAIGFASAVVNGLFDR